MGAFRARQQTRTAQPDLLPPQPRRRQSASFVSSDDISDAHFVVIGKAQPHFEAEGSNDNIIASGSGTWVRSLMPAVANRAETVLERLSDRAFAIMVAVIFGAVFMIASGIAAMQPAGPASRPMLDITHSSLTPQDSNGMRVLLVNGIIENRSGDLVAVPQIRADLLQGERLVASTLIDAPVSLLEGGFSRGFSAKLQHPGGKSPQLRLSFVQQDAMLE